MPKSPQPAITLSSVLGAMRDALSSLTQQYQIPFGELMTGTMRELTQRWLRLIGQNVPFLKCSPVVVRLHGLSQCGQVVEVELIRRFVVKRRVRSLLVVKREILL